MICGQLSICSDRHWVVGRGLMGSNRSPELKATQIYCANNSVLNHITRLTHKSEYSAERTFNFKGTHVLDCMLCV